MIFWISVTAHNRGDQDAELHLLPTLWFRNTWWADATPAPRAGRLLPMAMDREFKYGLMPEMGAYELRFEGKPALLFTDNETNQERFGGKSVSVYTKDAFHRFLLHGETKCG